MSGEQSSRHSDNDDSFHDYKNLLHQEDFVQNANFYAGGKRNNVIILRNECKGKEKLFGMRVQIIHSSFMPRTRSPRIFARMLLPSELERRSFRQESLTCPQLPTTLSTGFLLESRGTPPHLFFFFFKSLGKWTIGSPGLWIKGIFASSRISKVIPNRTDELFSIMPYKKEVSDCPSKTTWL